MHFLYLLLFHPKQPDLSPWPTDDDTINYIRYFVFVLFIFITKKGQKKRLQISLKSFLSCTGFEPVTHALKGRCSTN